MIAWTVTSFVFGVFLANFGAYGRAYRTLGAIITFLICAWLTSIAILVGIELDSEIEREREIAVGQPGVVDRIQLPLRHE